MTAPPDVPWLEYDEIRQYADAFLKRTHPANKVPVPIEMIVEKEEKLDIIPVPGLRAGFDIEGWLPPEGAAIWVDEWNAYHHEHRYRFTLAHEMGHREMHLTAIRGMRSSIASLDDWCRALTSFSPELRGRFEFQAHCFAGLVLVPGPHLIRAYDQMLPQTQALVRTCLQKGSSKKLVLDYATEHLAENIAPVFNVSSDVVGKRLDREDLTVQEP